MNKLMQIEMMEPSDPEYFKLSKWLDGVMKIPFGNYVELPVNKNDPSEKIYEFINKVQIDMENSTYGHKDAKNKIMQIVCQWISNPKSSGNVIAIQGPPGIGKTSLVKNGISKALDRPFHMIALGGATDSTFLEGHSYTYEGSNWGRIVNILMDSKIMNPVIFFDELDKVSSTKQGEEIIGVLTHLTDQTQNSNFNDKYFSGIDLDLSKCLFVFSYNDESLINPILKDRLVKINLHGFSIDEKLAIAKDYLLKELSNNIGISTSEIIFSDEILKEIITKHTSEDGVRDLRRCLETILLKLNMVKYTNKLDKSLSNVNFPVNLTSSIVSDLLKKSEDNSHYQHNKHHHSIYL
jgi:ATP-dependent Lon protease